MTPPALTPEQEARAPQLAELITRAGREEVLALARLLVARPDDQLLGATEFRARDLMHRLGAKALEAALGGRKKGDTSAPA